MVPPARLELALSYLNQILSLARLPIPPQGPWGEAPQFSHSTDQVNGPVGHRRAVAEAMGRR